MDDTGFSLRNNAKRAAERMIHNGTAPSIGYGLRTREDGRFEIVWKSGAPDPASSEDVPEGYTGRDIPDVLEPSDAEDNAAAEAHEDEIDRAVAAERIAEIEQDPGSIVEGATLEERLSQLDETEASAPAEPEPDPWPAGARVSVAVNKRKIRTGAIASRVDKDHWRVAIDGAAASVTTLFRGDQFSPLKTGEEAPEPKPEKKERRRPATQRPSKSSELDAAAAAGVMPEKPIVTSKANPHYQKRFDHLAAQAAAGDWDAVKAYEVNGINSYAKMVRQYRDRLLAAHAASQNAPREEEAA